MEGNNQATFRWPAWLNAAALLLASMIAVAAPSLQIRPDTEVMAVAFHLWVSTQEILDSRGRRFRQSRDCQDDCDSVVVRPGDREGMIRLRKAGARLTIDPRSIAGCFNRQDKGI